MKTYSQLMEEINSGEQLDEGFKSKLAGLIGSAIVLLSPMMKGNAQATDIKDPKIVNNIVSMQMTANKIKNGSELNFYQDTKTNKRGVFVRHNGKLYTFGDNGIQLAFDDIEKLPPHIRLFATDFNSHDKSVSLTRETFKRTIGPFETQNQADRYVKQIRDKYRADKDSGNTADEDSKTPHPEQGKDGKWYVAITN